MFGDLKALLAGLLTAFAVAAGIYFGSRGLKHFDPAVTWYAVGSLLAAFAVAYRFTVWAQRPPSRLYFKRGLQLLLERLAAKGRRVSRLAPHALRFTHRPMASPSQRSRPPMLEIVSAFASNFLAQTFIRRRSRFRWVMHLCLSGGCTLAFAITFPLVFGWVHFTTLPDNAEVYRTHVFGFQVDQFHHHSAKAFLTFNLLNLAAVIVMIGLVLAAVRRLTDAGERATQKFAEDILPLLLIFAVTATGLMLAVSYKFMGGRGHSVIGMAHMVSVILLLFFIPFGKLFHMFQRSCALCVAWYKEAGQSAHRVGCRRCGGEFASQMHVEDLKIVLDQLGFNYRFSTSRGEIHYQDICPACRRRLLALNQGRTLGR